MTSAALAPLEPRVKSLALALGFDAAGVASPEPGDDTRFFETWVERGYAGTMAWLTRRSDQRVDPDRVLEGVRSVVAVALFHPVADAAELDPPPGRARVARYAGGEDYHDVMIDRLHALAAGMEALAGRALRTRPYVDTGPVLERVFAARAGLGWIGKNTCLIDRALGSRMMLGVVLTDLELAADGPEPDHCGTCRACLDACPTDAFAEPYVLDATRCISYTTIELREKIPEDLREGQGHWLFGCDVCQDVCPWNRRRAPGDLADPLGLRERLEPDPRFVQADLAWILELDQEAYLEATRGTALRRVRFRGLVRNALVAAGNSGDADLKPYVEAWAASQDSDLAEHAIWALARL
jgi:epoxyqueuosine reductase